MAKDGPKVIGTIGLKDIGNAEAALRKMFVSQTYRGKTHGVAQRLLDTSLIHAADCGIKRVFLGTTSKFIAAHRFYSKNGFEEIEKNMLPPEFPLMAVDTKFYMMTLR